MSPAEPLSPEVILSISLGIPSLIIALMSLWITYLTYTHSRSPHRHHASFVQIHSTQSCSWRTSSITKQTTNAEQCHASHTFSCGIVEYPERFKPPTRTTNLHHGTATQINFAASGGRGQAQQLQCQRGRFLMDEGSSRDSCTDRPGLTRTLQG